MSKSGGRNTGTSGTSAWAKNNATHKAATLPISASRPCGARLCTTQVKAPIHQTTTAATIASAVGVLVQNALCAAADASSATPNLTAAAALSAAIDSMNMAESAVARPAGRTNSAATASSMAAQATAALSP